jgi:hypothetical protein
MTLRLALLREDGGQAVILDTVPMPTLRDQSFDRIVHTTTEAMRGAIKEEVAREVLSPPRHHIREAL